MTKYVLNVETDFDFSLEYKGQMLADCDITLVLNSVDDLNDVLLRGPFGAQHSPEQRWEWDEALAAIRKNPGEYFSNQGGNRGVSWTVVEVKEQAEQTLQRRVVCAAMQRRPDGAIICGARHYDAIMRHQINNSLLPATWKGAYTVQGFIDNFGVFMTREEAHLVASAANQIIRRCGGDATTLYSENLY